MAFYRYSGCLKSLHRKGVSLPKPLVMDALDVIETIPVDEGFGMFRLNSCFVNTGKGSEHDEEDKQSVATHYM